LAGCQAKLHKDGEKAISCGLMNPPGMKKKSFVLALQVAQAERDTSTLRRTMAEISKLRLKRHANRIV
jgi:hypothetical protein